MVPILDKKSTNKTRDNDLQKDVYHINDIHALKGNMNETFTGNMLDTQNSQYIPKKL